MSDAETQGRLRSLEVAVKAGQYANLATILALTRKGILEPDEIIRALTVAAVYAGSQEGEDVRLSIETFLGLVNALTRHPVDPFETMLTSAGLLSEANPEQRESLKDWLTQATDGEIAQDLQEFFARLIAQSRARGDGEETED